MLRSAAQLGTRWCSWLTPCAVSRKVADLISVGAIEIFTDFILPASNRKEYHEYPLRGTGGQCLQLTTLALFVPIFQNFWEPQPDAAIMSCPGLRWLHQVVAPRSLYVFGNLLWKCKSTVWAECTAVKC